MITRNALLAILYARWPAAPTVEEWWSPTQRAQLYKCPVLIDDIEAQSFVDGFTHCYWCGGKFDGRRRRAMDHLIPLVRGGPHSKENIVASCSVCNKRKGGSDPFAFAERVGKRFERGRFGPIFEQMHIEDDDWEWRMWPDQKLLSPWVPTFDLHEKYGVWVTGWSGFCKDFQEWIRVLCPPDSRLVVWPGQRGRQRRAVAISDPYYADLAPRMLVTLGGVVQPVPITFSR